MAGADDAEIARITGLWSSGGGRAGAAGAAAAGAAAAVAAAAGGGAAAKQQQQQQQKKKAVAYPLTPGEVNEINAIIANALREDLGGYGSLGDVTTLSTVAAHVTATARFMAKADGVLAGVGVAQLVFDMVDKTLKTDWSACDGDAVKSGQHFGTVSGSARSILIAERLALNLLQRMSGVATQTRRMVEAVAHTRTRILDTRKTLPGLRVVEKLAVRIAGGTNHRYGLFDMVMVKDNHVDASGGVEKAVRNVHAFLDKNGASAGRGGGAIAIELETRTLAEVKQALALGGVDRIMLDNMVSVNKQTGAIDTSMLAQAMALIDAHNAKARAAGATDVKAATTKAGAGGSGVFPLKVVESEASGNVTLATVAKIAETGVDFISSGSLTHSAIALDISLKIATAKL